MEPPPWAEDYFNNDSIAGCVTRKKKYFVP